MSRKIILIPIGKNKNLISIVLSLSQILNKNKIDFNFYSPILCNKQSIENLENTYLYIKSKYKSIHCMNPVLIKSLASLLNDKKYLKCLEKILDSYYTQNNKKLVLIEGVSYSKNISTHFYNQLNLDITQALHAEIIFIITLKNNSFDELSSKMYILRNFFLKNNNLKSLGIIFNNYLEQSNSTNDYDNINIQDNFFLNKNNFIIKRFFQYNDLPILGFNSTYKISFFIDRECFLKFFNAKTIFLNEINFFRITSILIILNNNFNFLNNFNEKTLLIVNSKNFFSLEKILFFLQKNKTYVSILIILDNTEKYITSPLCNKLIKMGISIFYSQENFSSIFFNLNKINFNQNKIIQDKKILYNHSFPIVSNKIYSILQENYFSQDNISSYKFLYKLKKLSKKLNKSIILPEGENVKIIKSAYLCHKFNLCRCILLGNPKKIHEISLSLGIKLSKKIIIYDPKIIISKYVKFFYKFNKNIKLTQCKKILENNNIILSMLLLIKKSKYHGLVAGIINTTANVVRPALKLVKMKKDINLISSIFFMLFSDKVLVYGDCAINPNPSALELSEIAIQSADSAKNFGITPRIAMLSYSTNNSGGSGEMVEKVKIATNLVRKKRPDLLIEGPIQYDAATDILVSNIKCPKSKLLGNANIFIFPDLNSGNIAYKAVQRSTKIISIGPIIQGLKKPVNDLSRGASIQDILYTILITAIQSKNI